MVVELQLVSLLDSIFDGCVDNTQLLTTRIYNRKMCGIIETEASVPVCTSKNYIDLALFVITSQVRLFLVSRRHSVLSHRSVFCNSKC